MRFQPLDLAWGHFVFIKRSRLIALEDGAEVLGNDGGFSVSQFHRLQLNASANPVSVFARKVVVNLSHVHMAVLAGAIKRGGYVFGLMKITRQSVFGSDGAVFLVRKPSQE
jgi:hypothetical protein